MRLYAAPTLSRLRKAGKLAEAQQGVDRWLALARRLTQSYPDQAATYMFLSEGYVQKAKNGYRVPGESAIRWEREALTAAIRAGRAIPRMMRRTILIRDRRARLQRLASQSLRASSGFSRFQVSARTARPASWAFRSTTVLDHPELPEVLEGYGRTGLAAPAPVPSGHRPAPRTMRVPFLAMSAIHPAFNRPGGAHRESGPREE